MSECDDFQNVYLYENDLSAKLKVNACLDLFRSKIDLT